nr:hypothetical protein [Cylindrospermopsis raciborskii]
MPYGDFSSIARAIDLGSSPGIVMYECVKNDIPFVLAGSIRDDGPLPDTSRPHLSSAGICQNHSGAEMILCYLQCSIPLEWVI